MSSADYVVLGGGIAGVSCAQTLRLLAPDAASIVLVTATEVVKAVTELTQLTKLLSSFSVIERNVQEWRDENTGVQLLQGLVTHIDRVSKTVYLQDQEEIRYKKLCICTGGHPKLLTENNPHVLGIRDTQSVINFQKKLRDATKVMVVGNGGIATEIVYELTGLDIIWAVKDSSISSVFVDPGAGEFLSQKLRDKDTGQENSIDKPVKRMKYCVDGDAQKDHLGSALGPDWHKGFCTRGSASGTSVQVEYKVEVEEILSPEQYKSENLSLTNSDAQNREWNVYVKLSNGRVYGCDFVISATGVLPSGDLFSQVVDVDAEGAIKVDDNMRTSDPDIYAAGDICSAHWSHAHHWLQMRLWTQARQMGIMAAKMMLAHSCGEQLDLDFCFEMFAHVTNFFGYKVVLLGLYNGQKLDSKYEVLLRVTPGVEYVKVKLFASLLKPSNPFAVFRQ